MTFLLEDTDVKG